MAIKRSNWVSRFNLIGEVKLNDNSIKLNETNESSTWIYNVLNLGVNCGENNGVVYAEMMGGYSSSGKSVIYAHGKDADGKDDFEDRFEIEWEDRFDEDTLKSVGDLCFITVGLEKNDKGGTVYKKFLSEFDAIEYINENISDGMVVNVKGSLNYSLYNDKVSMRKRINSISLSKATPDRYIASFSQSVLLDKDSVNLKEIDKDTGIVTVVGRVLDYAKEINGVEIKGQYPYYYSFNFKFDLSDKKLFDKTFQKVFKVAKDITQVNFDGEFVQLGDVVQTDESDLTDDIKELIALGLYTKEEALAKCTNGYATKYTMLKRPIFTMVENNDVKTPVIQKYESAYTEDDLTIGTSSINDEPPFVESENLNSSTDDLSWLNDIA